MLSFAFKWMPLMTIAAGSAAAADKFKPILEYTRVVAVQVEVNEIGRMLALDQIGNELPSPQQFPDYLRRNLRITDQSGKTRDPSKDQWGVDYRLEITSARMKVTSAGPDQKFGTSDDIYAALRI